MVFKNMPKIYTKTGDDGTTSLFGGKRLPKDDLRVAAYGDIDELNAHVGVALTKLRDQNEIAGFLTIIQNVLFALGAGLSNPEQKKQKSKADFGDDKTLALEGWIDRMEQKLKPMKTFILPGGGEGAACLHLCRTVCRRAERTMITLHQKESLPAGYLVFVNRLSDFFFVAARYANHLKSISDVAWE